MYYQNRKGQLSQNVLAAYTFFVCSTSLGGFRGRLGDFKKLLEPGFSCSQWKFLSGGYGLDKHILVPFRGVGDSGREAGSMAEVLFSLRPFSAQKKKGIMGIRKFGA